MATSISPHVPGIGDLHEAHLFHRNAAGTWTSQEVLRATVGANTADQVLQVSMRLSGWAGGVPWAGLMARYRDSGNYDYIAYQP